MKWYCLGILLLSMLGTKAQNISTFAGCVSMSCIGIGDGHPATAANLDDPSQGVFDKYGNYYLAEGLGQRIRKIDVDGSITTLVGDGSSGFGGDNGVATAALLSSPGAVIIDTFGNLYIADAGNARIRKVNAATGIITTIVGNGTGAYFGDGGPATAAEIWGPQNICFDKLGNLYITDAFNYRVRKVNTSGIITTFAGGAFSGTGTGDGGPATAATFNLLVGVVADDTGNIYISDYNAGKIRKVDTFGIITTFAGNGNYTYIGDGMPALSAQMAPEWLVFDSSQNLIISDRYNERVYKIDKTDGIFHCIAGIGGSGVLSGDGGPATAASLDPGGICFDPCGNLYIPDIDNDRVRKISYYPTCSPRSIDSLEALNVDKNYENAFVSIYPNPVYNELIITATPKITHITITNLIGQTVYNQEYNTDKAEINLASFPSGVYIVAIIDEEGNKTIKKVVKQ